MAARLARQSICGRVSGILSDAKNHPRFHSQTLVRSVSLTFNPEGVGLRARAAHGDSGKRPERPWVIADPVRHFGRLSRGGWSPASKTGAKQMSRKDAHAFAASLAATLMVSIVVFQAGDGSYGAVPADEIDGDEVMIVSEYDPFA